MTLDRKQSAVARRISKHIDSTSTQSLLNTDSSLSSQINQTQLNLNDLSARQNNTSLFADSINNSLNYQLDPNITGTLANLVQRASYYYIRYLNTIDLSTSGGGGGPVSTGGKYNIPIGLGFSYTKGQDVSLVSEDNPEAFIFGKVASYDTTTGDLSVYVDEVGTGSSDRWTVNVGAPTIQRYDIDGGFASTDLNGGTATAGGGFDLDGGVA